MNNLGIGPLDKTKYQMSKAEAFQFHIRRVLKFFPHTSLCKTSDLQDGVIFTPGHNLNNFGKGPSAEATYQI